MTSIQAGIMAIALLGVAACGGESSADGPAPSTETTAVAADATTTTAEAPTEATEPPGTITDREPQDTNAYSPPENLALISCTPVDAGRTTVVPLPDWNVVGDRELLVLIHKVSPTLEFQFDASETPVSLTVGLGDADGWQFSWQANSTALNLTQLGESERALVEELMANMPRMVVDYSLSSDRYWGGVANPSVVRDDALSALGALSTVLPELDSATMERLTTFYQEMSDDQISLTFAEEPQIYHALGGIPLDVGERYEGSDVLPNPFGGQPFPAAATLEVLELVDDDGCVLFEQVTVPDPEEFGRILQDSIGVLTGTDGLEGGMPEGFSVVNRITVQFDAATGLSRQVIAVKTIEVEGQRRVDTKVIQDITP